jgi:hypothetical protein
MGTALVRRARGRVCALSWALRYADAGWPVFPCKAGSKEPAAPHGFRDSTLDPSQIRTWFEAGNYNIGLAIPPGRFVVDVDSPAALASLKAQDFELPSTATQRTPRDGWHFIFSHPDGVELRQTAGKIAAGVDTRAAGRGYIVAAPSKVHAKPYRWEVPPRPENIAPAPEWLLAACAQSPSTAAATCASAPRHPGYSWHRLVGGLAQGTRNDSLCRIAGHFLRHGVDSYLTLAAVLDINACRCRPPLPEVEVRRIVESVARREAARLRARGA